MSQLGERWSARVSLPHLTAFNFGIQFVWGAVLAVSLQARSIELGHNGVRAYATIASAGAAIGALTQIVVGRFADARCAQIGHRREFYVAGVAAAVPALLWFFLAPTLTALTAAFFAVQVGINTAMGPYQAAIPDHVAAGRSGAASSWMSAYQALGNAAGLVVAGFVTSYAVQGAVLASGLLAPFAVTLRHVRRLPARPTPVPGNSQQKSVRIGGPLGILLVSRGSINLGFYMLLGFLLFYVRDSLGIAAPATLRMQTALLFLSFTLAAIGGAILAARPTDRFDKRLVVAIAVGCVIGALAVLAAARTLAVAYAAAVFSGMGWGAFVTADWALACALLPTEAMASAMAVWNVATTAPQIAAPLVAAPLVERFNAVALGLGPRAAIALAIVAFAAGAAYTWRLPRAATVSSAA